LAFAGSNKIVCNTNPAAPGFQLSAEGWSRNYFSRNQHRRTARCAVRSGGTAVVAHELLEATRAGKKKTDEALNRLTKRRQSTPRSCLIGSTSRISAERERSRI
jgi:hypothetical protein